MKYEKGSFITIPNKYALRKLTLGARAVFLEVCDFADADGMCFPSRSLIAKNIQMSTDSVDRFIGELVENGLLEKSGRVRKDGSRTTNEYQILLVGSRTDAEGGSRTHPEAELYPVLTQTTIPRADARPLEIVETFEESESKRPRLAKPKQKAYDELIAWSERERGFPFLKTARLKQYTAFRIAGENGIPHTALVERWEEMSGDKFWKEKGFDWMNVVTSFNTKPV